MNLVPVPRARVLGAPGRPSSRSYLACIAKLVFVRRDGDAQVRKVHTTPGGRLHIPHLAQEFGLRPGTLKLNDEMVSYSDKSGLMDASVEEVFPDAGGTQESALIVSGQPVDKPEVEGKFHDVTIVVWKDGSVASTVVMSATTRKHLERTLDRWGATGYGRQEDLGQLLPGDILPIYSSEYIPLKDGDKLVLVVDKPPLASQVEELQRFVENVVFG